MKFKNIIKNVGVISLVVLLSGCWNECSTPVNLSVAKERVERYYESGCYRKDLEKIIASAFKHFESVSAENNATVIFDIDDTLLSDYADVKEISFGYIPKLSHKWIMEADAPAIQETKKLYDYLVGRKFKIIFMTGRKHDEYDATIKNLKREGFTTFEKLIVRQKHEVEITAKQYKSGNRKRLIEEGYRIVGNLGDQESDLSGGYSGYAVKLPNYKYLVE